MAKRSPRHQRPLIALIKAHGNRDENAFMAAAYELIDELDKEGEETRELTHILGAHLAKVTKGHSMDRETACSACGDIDGCHLWRIVEVQRPPPRKEGE